MENFQSPVIQERAQKLVEAIRNYSQRGWTPATSSNFSIRLEAQEKSPRLQVLISQSGRDKSEFQIKDLMVVGEEGEAIYPQGARPSAETLLHLEAYRDPCVQSVHHTHSNSAILVGEIFKNTNSLTITGLEILKGFSGVSTHEDCVEVPIFENTQNMRELAELVRQVKWGKKMSPGYLIRGHGVYAWGSSVEEAKRHVEVFEYLFEHLVRMEGLRHGAH